MEQNTSTKRAARTYLIALAIGLGGPCLAALSWIYVAGFFEREMDKNVLYLCMALFFVWPYLVEPVLLTSERLLDLAPWMRNPKVQENASFVIPLVLGGSVFVITPELTPLQNVMMYIGACVLMLIYLLVFARLLEVAEQLFRRFIGLKK